MPQLDISCFVSQLFWLGVSFLILFLGMRFLIQPRLERIFRKRSHKLDVKLREVDHLKAKTEKILSDIRTIEGEQRQVIEDILLLAHGKALKYIRKNEDFLHKNFLQEMGRFDHDMKRRRQNILQQMRSSERESTQMFLEELLRSKISSRRFDGVRTSKGNEHGS